MVTAARLTYELVKDIYGGGCCRELFCDHLIDLGLAPGQAIKVYDHIACQADIFRWYVENVQAYGESNLRVNVGIQVLGIKKTLETGPDNVHYHFCKKCGRWAPIIHPVKDLGDYSPMCLDCNAEEEEQHALAAQEGRIYYPF